MVIFFCTISNDFIAMRAILLTFVFCVILNIVIGDDESLQISPHIVKSYPKQSKMYKGLEVKLMNRSFKKKVSVVPLRTKRHTGNSYTVFPSQKDLNNIDIHVPDSPYFPLDRHVQDKSSVKKVLPNFEWTARKKRSADEKADGDKEQKKEEGTAQKILDDEKAGDKEIKKEEWIDAAQKSTNALLKKEDPTTVQAKTPIISDQVTKTPIKADGKPPRRSVQRPKRVRRRKSVVKKAKKQGKQAKRDRKIDGKKRKAKGSGRLGQQKSLPKAPKTKKLVAARRLIAGRDALVEEYPYAVSIQKGDEHWCSGALLNQRLVITTANCIWKASRVTRLRVRAGTRFSDRGGQIAKIQEVMKHPKWSIRSKPDHDVALLLLDRNIRFSHSVHAVDLPNRIMMPPFDDVWVTSWGTERRDGVYENKGLSLQAYHARLMDKEKCNNVTKRYGILVSENFICLAQTGKRAPCTRDTGAPAVSDGVLWGLASWGIRKLCGTERFPAMFSYIASQSSMDFIANATHFLMADERHYPFGDRYMYTQPTNEETYPVRT